MQAVIDMHRTQRQWRARHARARKAREQHGRVETAAKRDA
jgi:hypothetical protein